MKIEEPAFPSSNSPDTGHYAEGMTLRDYFAAKAMEMFLQKMPGVTGTNLYEHRVAKEAYTMADAMLKAREA